MSFNLPTGPGLSICNTRSLTIVKMNGKEPIDGGAGKIKKLDNEILNYARRKNLKANWKTLEADWIITSDSIFYINPFIGVKYEFLFDDWFLNFGTNRGYGFRQMMASVNIIKKENQDENYILKTSNSAQVNISYIFSKYNN